MGEVCAKRMAVVKGRVEILQSKILPDLDDLNLSIMDPWQKHSMLLPLIETTEQIAW